MTITANSIESAIKTRLLEMPESRYDLLKQASRLSSLGVDNKKHELVYRKLPGVRGGRLHK